MPDFDGRRRRSEKGRKEGGEEARMVVRQAANERGEEAQGEIDLAFDCVDDREMAGDSVGAHHDEEVGEGGDAGAEVG